MIKDITGVTREAGPEGGASNGPRYGSQPGPGPAAPQDDSPLAQFLGGSPSAVAIRLGFVSLIVGAMLMWLDIRPMDILHGIERFFARIWNLGFDAIHLVLQYVLVGAVIVVPIWLVMRLLNIRSTKS